MNVLKYLKNIIKNRGAAFCVLIDPDKSDPDKLREFMDNNDNGTVDALFIGSSLMMNDSFDRSIMKIKELSKVPVIIFPGSSIQVSKFADAILFISLISGRNPHLLFGEHVLAAPVIKGKNIQTISTGYMLIESGSVSTTEYISDTKPIPRNKSEIAVAHSLAAQFMGFETLYLEAGSGAPKPVPDEMITAVKKQISIPLIVGGGIKSPDTAGQKVKAGSDIIVIGNFLENNWSRSLLQDFSNAIHFKQ
ncbi:geranylgeranylglyceryl/heptaprenylglyceryl phosphate synthase [candidate division KSB1 bacterium]